MTTERVAREDLPREPGGAARFQGSAAGRAYASTPDRGHLGGGDGCTDVAAAEVD
jgi:hypothetical protein